MKTDAAKDKAKMLAMNEALLLGSLHQHELHESAALLNEKLHAEIAQRKLVEEALRQSNADLKAHVEELGRFNRVAVGRELRMLELKHELDQFADGRKPRERRTDAGRTEGAVTIGRFANAINPTQEAMLPARPAEEHLVPLESVLYTEELNRRPPRLPDYQTENRTLTALNHALVNAPQSILQRLADGVLELCRAHSAGISLLTKDGKRFHWPAIAGEWKSYIGGGTPRDFGPCSDVLDRNTPLLFKNFERRYAYFSAMTPPAQECLLVPVYIAGEGVGTLWAITHHDEPSFDAEDLRQLQSLAQFAASAFQAEAFVRVQLDTRRAALNLMEDALLARTAVETLNAELQASESRYRALFDSIDEGFCIIERVGSTDERPDFRCIEANPAFAVQYGIADAIGKTIRQMSPDITEDWLQTYDAVLRTGEPTRFERELSPPGRMLDLYAFRVEEDGQHRVAVIFKDVTQRSRGLRKNQDQAQALADLHLRKDEFLAMLSHELRNPLAPISNAVHILRLNKNEDPIQKQARSIIERQVGQLKHLIDDLLEVSRITTGRVNLHRERITVSGIVERAVETARPLITQRRHTLELSLPSQPIWLDADAARLEQVLVNLLTNAAKYTDEGGQIWLMVEKEDNFAVLRIRDTGVGIAPALLPHIFELFTQADRSLDRTLGGLGIGLCLVQRLVDLHGGSVQACSTLGKGSEFVVRLPTMTFLPLLPSIESETIQPAEKSHRVLIVEDNLDTAESLAMLLTSSGSDVRVVHDGPTALAAALAYQPDVVLLDIGLPGCNGYEVAKQMREQPILKNLMLVAMTGYGQESDLLRSRSAGFDHHLVKPVDFARVQQILATVPVNATRPQ